jgi:hypothetical protein
MILAERIQTNETAASVLDRDRTKLGRHDDLAGPLHIDRVRIGMELNSTLN